MAGAAIFMFHLIFIGRRLLHAIPLLFAITIFSFTILHVSRGDFADVMTGESGAADVDVMRELRHSLGLDRPAVSQLIDYGTRMFRFDLGSSFRYNMPVFDVIYQRIFPTLLLTTTSAAISLTLGVAFGVVAAVKHGSMIDDAISVVSLVAYATPVFWTGLLLIIVFSARLGWLPTSGMTDVARETQGFSYAIDVLRHLILPSLTLSSVYFAIYTRLMRASMLEVAGLDHVRTAYAKGLPPHKVLIRHVLRNALLPVVTMVGVQAGALLGGAVLVETVFAWPGVGRLTYDAVFQRDYPLLTGILISTSFLVVAVNIVTDLIYSILDPRISIK
jgi:peptide/nickel transport system permease protein